MRKLILYFFLLFSLFATSCKEKEKQVDIFSQLQEVNRLELARMTVGKVGMISDPDYRDAKGWENKASALFNTMKIGTRIGVYSYDTYIIAYLDLSKLTPDDIEIDKENSIARITLPPVEIMTDGREPQLHEEHSRVTGLRSSITPSERARLKAQMAREVKQELTNKRDAFQSLQASAEIKGKAWLSELLDNWGYKTEITFRKS